LQFGSKTALLTTALRDVTISTAEVVIGGIALGGGTGAEVVTLGGASPIALPVAGVGAAGVVHGGIGINNYLNMKRGNAAGSGGGSGKGNQAQSDSGLPTLKDSPFGPKISSPVPKNGVPRNWTKEQIQDATTDFKTSIASRKAEQVAFAGRGSEAQRIAHAQRITQEEKFLKSLEKASETRK
jgi:hypothetical protein